MNPLIAAAAILSLLPQPSGQPGATSPPPAQPQQGAQQEAPQEAQDQPRTIRYEDLRPAMKLGIRAEAVRRAWQVVPTVVIVPDSVSYVEAVARWTLRGRYPVLIDDGTAAAAEDIARFVRAFEPTNVVRWSSADDEAARALAWPADAAAQRAMIEKAVFRCWSSPMTGEGPPAEITSMEGYRARLKALGAPMPGIVVANPGDPAWPAALALAAGRCQQIVWKEVEQNINAAMPLERFSQFAQDMEQACESVQLPWKGLGDDIDAVTLCLNMPAKVDMGGGAVVAATDLLGRHPAQEADGKAGTREKGERWAWAGQIHGNEAQSAYRAMSALFLSPRRAWLFDGYPTSDPWNNYDCTEAGKHLRNGGMEVAVTDAPNNGERGWRSSMLWGVDAGFIMVNTKGNADEFNLEPGQCRPGELPILKLPAIVYFVHSWSAAIPGERATIAGRWFERGVYAYLGSTQEPYLHAFPPTPVMAARVLSNYPWGAAVRPDDGPAWKLALFGDPLITLGPPAPRIQEAAPLPGAQDVEELMRSAVAERRFEQAVKLLTILGRDADAARLAAAVLRDQPRDFTPGLAAAAIPPFFRARDGAGLLKAYNVLPRDMAADPVLRDYLWHAAYERLSGNISEEWIGTLRVNLRPDQVGRDAADLARAMASLVGRDAAMAMLNEAKQSARTDWDRARIDEALKLLSGRPGR